jgi:hypothetical protein
MKGRAAVIPGFAVAGWVAAAFIAGWAARASQADRYEPHSNRRPYTATREEKILAARALIAANRRRPGAVTPPEILALASENI